MSEFNARVKHKRDTSANWTSRNPVILRGELIIVDTADGDVRFKIGEGSKTYTQLPFQDETLYEALSSKANIADLANKSDSNHEHDDRYYTDSEIDSMEFITVSDIDTICNATITVASTNSEVRF